MSRYVLSPRARADLDDIWAYTARRWGTDQAEDYIRLVQNAIEGLRRRQVAAERLLDDDPRISREARLAEARRSLREAP